MNSDLSIAGVPIYRSTPKRQDNTFYYIRLSDLSEIKRELLHQWLRGHTTPIIDDLDPQDAVYLADYIQFDKECHDSE